MVENEIGSTFAEFIAKKRIFEIKDDAEEYEIQIHSSRLGTERGTKKIFSWEKLLPSRW